MEGWLEKVDLALTAQEVANRSERDCARRDLRQTLQLQAQLDAGEARGSWNWQNGWRGKDGAPEHIQPKTWWELTDNEKWWLRELRSGRLHKRVEDAEAKMHPVQARPFRM